MSKVGLYIKKTADGGFIARYYPPKEGRHQRRKLQEVLAAHEAKVEDGILDRMMDSLRNSNQDLVSGPAIVPGIKWWKDAEFMPLDGSQFTWLKIDPNNRWWEKAVKEKQPKEDKQ